MTDVQASRPPGRLKEKSVGTIDVIRALNKRDGAFPTQEQRVADYVKAHIDDISDMNIAALAEHCDVSKPTVIRFCRALGCNGFREFKLRLAQNLAVSQQYLKANPQLTPVSSETAIDQVFNALYENAMAMRSQFDQAAFEAARRALIMSRSVLFAGIGGGSSTVSQEGANRFFRLGIPAVATSDSYILQMRAATLGPQDVLVAVSASGEADALVAAIEIAQEYGATTIALTRPRSRMAEMADICISADLPEGVDIHMPTSSRYIHMMILDAMAYSVAQELSTQTTENLRRIRASLTAYHGRTGPQPLGD